MKTLGEFGLKEDGVLARMLAAVVPMPETFDVGAGDLKLSFRSIRSYTEVQDMTDKARQFEELLRKNMIPAVSKDLIPERAGDAAKAQFLAFFCLEPELQDPLPWLYLQKEEGLLFQHYFDEASAALTLRARAAEVEGVEEKKDRSDPTLDSEPASS